MTARPRIVEIGDHAYFSLYLPENAELIWTGDRPPHHRGFQAPWRPFGPRALLDLRRRLKSGDVDLVVVYASEFAPWNVRAWGRLLLRDPLRFAGRFIRSWGAQAARLLPRGAPIVGVDTNDSFAVEGHNRFLLDHARIYFKRELPVDRWRALIGLAGRALPSARLRRMAKWRARIDRLRPMPLGFQVPRASPPSLDDERPIDIFWAGTVTGSSTAREAGIAELRALAGEGYAIDIPDAPISTLEFRRRLRRSLMVWSPEGFGWDCYRHSMAALAGAVPLINYPAIARHAPMIDGEHAVFYAPEPGGLARAARAALADRARLRRMGLAAREHVLAHHVYPAVLGMITAAMLGDEAGARVRAMAWARELPDPDDID